jgi:nitroimidazol reductase NimA-like FMN-containing flavoprotein (pyridoxamine 5'-phosphate oxidase superfamily)
MGKPIPESEIRNLAENQLWGTLIAIDDGQPYAVETSFATDETCLYTGTKRGGRMNRCIEKNPAASFKICDGDRRGRNYRAAIIESQAEILTRREDILYCLKIIFTKLGLSTDSIETKADTFAAGKGSLTLYRLPLKKLGGIASARTSHNNA